jgi:hypothetical protein
MNINNALEAARYGNLSRVAIQFYISTGNPAELDAAVCYARAAAYFAHRADETPSVNYASAETCYGRTVGYGFAVKVF